MRTVIMIYALLVMTVVVEAEVMPPLRVETLLGDSLVVPTQTTMRPPLFVVGFSQKSRTQTSQWTQRLESDDPQGDPPYQVAILDDVQGFFRGLVLRAVRNGVPERLHKRFLIVTEADEWKRLARFLDPDDAYLLLIGAGGEVVWRTKGKLTEEHFRALLQALRIARAKPSLL